MKAAMDQRLVVGVVQSPEAVMHCPHLAERGTFLPWTIPRRDCCSTPGPGFLAHGSNPAAGGRAAPRLGEHNVEVYAGELGLSTAELAMLRAAGVI